MRLEQRVNTYGAFLKERYGKRVFRAGLSYGLPCEHRQKTGGCIFCLPETFLDSEEIYGESFFSVGNKQLAALIPKISQGTGIDVNDSGRFLAYYQAGIPSTIPAAKLKKLYLQTLSHPGIAGLIIAARPADLKEEIVEMLKALPADVYIEIGMQSIHQKSLNWLHRNQLAAETAKALDLCAKHQLKAGVHLIIGIPGENRADVLATIDYVNSSTVINEVKLHNLVVYKGTPLALYPHETLQAIPSVDEYIELLGEVIAHLRKDIVISRFFTSNVKGNNQALNPFLGVKRAWLNSLTSYLNETDIVQGMNCHQRA